MFIPGATAPVAIPSEAALGILATALSALSKASKTNSTAPIGILLKERLSVGERKALNVMLHSMAGAIAKAGKKKPTSGTKVNQQVTNKVEPKAVKQKEPKPISQLIRDALSVKH